MKKITIVLAFALFIFASCEKEVIQAGEVVTQPKFANIQAIFTSAKCTSCHKAGATFELSLAYLKSKNLISKPGASCGLLAKINAGHNATSVTASDKTTIATWVDAGAPAK